MLAKSTAIYYSLSSSSSSVSQRRQSLESGLRVLVPGACDIDGCLRFIWVNPGEEVAFLDFLAFGAVAPVDCHTAAWAACAACACCGSGRGSRWLT